MEEEKYPNWFMQTGYWYFSKHLEEYKNVSGLRFLQIGSYTGDASVWLLDNILTDETSSLTDVDTWLGSDEIDHKSLNWNEVEKIYDKRTSKYNNVVKFKGYSKDFLESCDDCIYDFIYIDGDHTAAGVYSDALLSWKILKSGGILAFDDYTWTGGNTDPEKYPKTAIDKFLFENKGQYELLEIKHQVWIRKK